MSWIPLHVHSQYSLLEAAGSIEALVEKAREWQLPAMALTDQGNMYGAVEFAKACKVAGLKALIGCELVLAPYSRLDKKKIPGLPSGFPIVLLAKDAEGYRNLSILSSLAHLEGFYWTPGLIKSFLQSMRKGSFVCQGPMIVCLDTTSCRASATS